MANAVTGIRVVCALALIFCPPFSVWFYLFCTVGGISDVLDGILARHLGKETKFGAQFDTIADTLFIGIVILKTVRAIPVPLWSIIWIVCIAVMKIINMISGFVIYKRFVCEHTVMNKLCGVLLFAFPLCLGLLSHKAVTGMIALLCAIATVAAIQEGVYIRTGKEVR